MEKALITCFYYSLTVVTLAIFLLISPFCSDAAEKTVALVGDTVITETDLLEALEQYKPTGTYHASIDRSSEDEYRIAALNDLIEMELLSREAQKRGTAVAESEVESVMHLNIKRFGSEEKMKKALETRGLTLDALKQKIRKNQLSRDFLKELANENRSSDEEVKEYYVKNLPKYRKPDAIFLYHILIKVDPSAPEEVWQEKKKFAEQLLEKIRGGADFGSIAYQYSEDPYRYKSGELGFVHRGRLSSSELEDAAFGLKKDELIGAIRTIYGFHILKAGDRMAGETKEFEEVKDRIRKELDNRRFDEAKKTLMERLGKEYVVERRLKSGKAVTEK